MPDRSSAVLDRSPVRSPPFEDYVAPHSPYPAAPAGNASPSCCRVTGRRAARRRVGALPAAARVPQRATVPSAAITSAVRREWHQIIARKRRMSPQSTILLGKSLRCGGMRRQSGGSQIRGRFHNIEYAVIGNCNRATG